MPFGSLLETPMSCPYFAFRAIGNVIASSVHALWVFSGDPYTMSIFAFLAVGLVIASSIHAIWVLFEDPYGRSLFCVSGSRPCNRQLGSCNLGLFLGPLWYVPILRFGQSAL